MAREHLEVKGDHVKCKVKRFFLSLSPFFFLSHVLFTGGSEDCSGHDNDMPARLDSLPSQGRDNSSRIGELTPTKLTRRFIRAGGEELDGGKEPVFRGKRRSCRVLA